MNICQMVHPGKVSTAGEGRIAGQGLRRPLAGLLMVALFLGAAVPSPGWSASSELPMVSVRVQEQPLGEVLADLERKTGYAITVKEQWKDYPVEVGFKDKPLDKALKSILADFNHAIFFGPGKQIRIAIYTLKEYGGGDAAGSPAYVPPGPNPEEPPPVEPPPEEPERYDEEQSTPPEPMPEGQADMPNEEPTGEDAGEVQPAETQQGEAGEGENTPGEQEPDLPPGQSD